jgi:cytochrome c peroxidase
MTRFQLAGRVVFREEGCGTCHEAPRFTISGDGSRLRNIGTLDPAAGKRLSGPLKGIDVPTLRGVALTAPYFHDGSAASLADAISRHKGVKLTKREMARLVQYLKSL